MLTNDEKSLLLEHAREAIARQLNSMQSTPHRQIKSKSLQSKRGCFVTIKIDGKLRGCIGNLTSDTPLHRLVEEMAVSAATMDPRFYPLKEEELALVTLEISVLSPLKKIVSPEEITVGIHGLYLEKNYSRGVLLPQVPIEYGWDRTTFLRQTCLKAGLLPDDWKNDADIYIFSAEVFS